MFVFLAKRGTHTIIINNKHDNDNNSTKDNNNNNNDNTNNNTNDANTNNVCTVEIVLLEISSSMKPCPSTFRAYANKMRPASQISSYDS